MSCETNKSNLGLSKCKSLPQLPRGIITTPANFKVPAATAADPAALQTYLENAVKAGKANRIYLWPFFVGFENVSEETIYEENALADMLVRDGKYRYRFHIKESLCLHKAMFTHRQQSERVFIIDVENQIFGTELSNGDFAGFSVSLFNVEKLMVNDGTVSTKTPIYLVLQDSKEVDEKGMLIKASFLSTLTRLVDVKLTVSNVLAGSLKVSVNAVCDGTPVSGLVLADFLLTTTAGAAQAPSAVVEDTNVPGLYTLTRAALADGFVDLVAAANLSVPGYESVGKVVVDVP
jgi:hypothetical protein